MGKRTGRKPDELITASLLGIVARHSRGGELSAEQRDAVIAELRAETTRADLLAEVAGLKLGFDGDQAAHDLLVEAGADTDAIPAWAEEGKRRARKLPHSAP